MDVLPNEQLHKMMVVAENAYKYWSTTLSIADFEYGNIAYYGNLLAALRELEVRRYIGDHEDAVEDAVYAEFDKRYKSEA